MQTRTKQLPLAPRMREQDLDIGRAYPGRAGSPRQVVSIDGEYSDGILVRFVRWCRPTAAPGEIAGGRCTMDTFLDWARPRAQLPRRWWRSWPMHNLVAHPVSEILALLGFEALGNRVHDGTLPPHQQGTGRG